MKTLTSVKSFIFTTCVFFILFSFQKSFSKTLYLNSSSSDQTSTFQSLVNQCVQGDIIIVRTGNHYLSGTVVVNKNGITIRGENGNAIRKSGNVSCIDVTCSNSTFDNLYIDGGNRPEPCMRVYGNYNKILNCTFRNSGNSGLLIHQCHHNWIEGCKAYYNYMVGISQWAHSDGTIKNCQMYENGAEGLTIDGGSHNCMVYGNWIHKNNLPHRGVGGIGIDASNGAWIYNNTIDYNGYDGIKFQNNLCCGDDGCRIYDNPNISYNEQCAVKFRLTYPVTNFGWWNNTCVGNPGGERCTTYNALSEAVVTEIDLLEDKDIEISTYGNIIHISKLKDKYTKFFIYNMNGQCVLTSNFKESEFMIGDLPSGIYLIKVQNNKGQQIIKKVLLQ